MRISTRKFSSITKSRKLIVFGGNGFVGQAVVANALKLGIEVESISRSGKPTVGPLSKVEHTGLTWRKVCVPSNYKLICANIQSIGRHFRSEHLERGYSWGFVCCVLHWSIWFEWIHAKNQRWRQYSCHTTVRCCRYVNFLEHLSYNNIDGQMKKYI